MKSALNIRLAELWEEIEQAGLTAQVTEIIRIRSNPEASYSQLLQRRRLARKLVGLT